MNVIHCSVRDILRHAVNVITWHEYVHSLYSYEFTHTLCTVVRTSTNVPHTLTVSLPGQSDENEPEPPEPFEWTGDDS